MRVFFLVLASITFLLIGIAAVTATDDTKQPSNVVAVATNAAPSTASNDAGEVNVYSARQEELIRPLLNAFTEQTRIRVNIISGEADALLNRIASEAQNSPVDVLLTTDAGRLWRAKQAGVLRTVESSTLTELIPAHLRDPENQWFGLSVRARPLMLSNTYLANTPANDQPNSYADLADPRFAQQICIRSSSNIYNQSMVASIIANSEKDSSSNNLGSQTIRNPLEWATGLVTNFARKPQGGDRDQIKAAALGQCGIAVANTYYLAGMLSDTSPTEDQAAAQAVTVIWPDQEGHGTHINVSGAGIAQHSPNPDNALALLEFLASDTAQAIYANVNFEYPIREGIELHPILQGFGSFKADSLDLSELGERNPQAVMLMDKAGWR